MAWKKLIYFVFAVSLNPINFNVVTLSDTKLTETSLENREMHPWGDLRYHNNWYSWGFYVFIVFGVVLIVSFWFIDVS